MQGEEIPEEARIAAVTDVFDALTSHRVYRPALSFDQAIAMMRDLRGRQFEPRLLDAFFDSMPEITMIRKTYPDEDDGERRIRVLVVDDHEIFAHSLVRLLGSRDELKVVGFGGNRRRGGRFGRLVRTRRRSSWTSSFRTAKDRRRRNRFGADSIGQGGHADSARTTTKLSLAAIAAGCSGFVKKEDDDREPARGDHSRSTMARRSLRRSTWRPCYVCLRPTKRGLGFRPDTP